MADKTDITKHMNALVTPIEHVDVRGNKLLYLKIQGPNGETVVNIGQKTFDGVTKILQPRETSTQLNILEPIKETYNSPGINAGTTGKK